MSSNLAPVASVIVPSHRGAHRLPVLLDALAAQDLTEPWELVVVLDGIHDDSPQILARYEGAIDLRWIQSPPPHGAVAALNAGYEAARGRVLIRCDDDLTPGPSMVRRHVEHHRDRDDLGVIGATRDVFPDTPYARAYGRPANARSLTAIGERSEGDRHLHWAAHNSVTRTTWDHAGGFDPRFVYGEDYELGVRLGRAGVTFVLDPALELEHRGPSTTAATRVPRAFVSGASRRLVEQVHGADALPAGPGRPRGWRARLWAGAVTAIARSTRTREGFARLGRVADAALPRLPLGVGGRAVALLVEAAGRSGRLHGAADLSVYKGQKAAELSRETTPH